MVPLGRKEFIGSWLPPDDDRAVKLPGRLGDADEGGAQHAIADLEARLHHLHNGAWRLLIGRHLEHRLMEMRIELLAHRIDALDAMALEDIEQFAPRHLDPGHQILDRLGSLP